MAKNSIVRVSAPTAAELAKPDYLQNVEPTGTELLKDYVILPRLKVLQALSDQALVAQFGVGSIIAVPLNVCVCEVKRDQRGNPTGEVASFRFVPLLFWPEWWKTNPIELRGSMPMIVERSLDPSSEIAIRSRDPRRREQPHPTHQNLMIRCVEVLNYAIQIIGEHPLSGEILSMSFARGEYMAGSRFAGLIKMRSAPIYACVFEASAVQRTGTKGTWWGIDVTTPRDGSPWVDQAHYERLIPIHEQLKKTHAEARLRAADDEDVGTDADESADEQAAAKF